jgi:hypothetical protein
LYFLEATSTPMTLCTSTPSSPITPAHGFMASSAPAERVAFSTKRKAMDLPSGDQAGCWRLPVRWVSWWISPVERDQRKIWAWSGLSSVAAQVERKARVWPSGDQTGEVLVHSLGVSRRSLAGSGSATAVRCSVESSAGPSVQATSAPSGEMAAPVGIAAWAPDCADTVLAESSRSVAESAVARAMRQRSIMLGSLPLLLETACRRLDARWAA